jgi:hypothetical protein
MLSRIRHLNKRECVQLEKKLQEILGRKDVSKELLLFYRGRKISKKLPNGWQLSPVSKSFRTGFQHCPSCGGRDFRNLNCAGCRDKGIRCQEVICCNCGASIH